LVALSSLALPSFAKTNWILKILGLREDGFHELRTVFQMLDLKDELILRVTADPEIRIQVRGRAAPAGPGNLVYRAARLLKRTAGVSSGVELTLTKRIPLGAGLGGGSGNAAVTLLGLNQLWGCGFSLSSLTALAAELGSDVAFFLRGGSDLGEGRGELITSLPDLRRSVDIVLLYPGRGLSTKVVYSMRNWGVWEGGERLTRSWTKNTIHRFSRFSVGLHWAHLENDFETLLFQRYGFLEEARKALIALGCERVMVCGSGSTLMGLGCRDRRQWGETPSACQGGGELLFCSTLSSRRYRKLLRESGLDVLA
jgi:4-diphosphocytidyl-2-C-methyl-D-erythritol kinase